MGARLLQGDHGLDVDDDAGDRAAHVLLRVRRAQLQRLLEGHAIGHVAVERVVRRGLIGDEVWSEPAAHELGIHVRGVAEERDRQRLLRFDGLIGEAQGLVERICRDVHVGGLDTTLDAVRVDLDAERDAAGHGDGQRLGAAHTAEPGRQDEPPGKVGAVVLLTGGREGLVGALQDALRTDVDPAAGGHLPVHGKAERVEAPELVPVRPVGHQVCVGDEHAGRLGVRREDADRLAAGDEKRLVVAQTPQRRGDRVERLPAARRLAGAAVDDELVGSFRDLGVEVVVEHAQGGLLLPALAADLRAARCAHRARPCRLRGSCAVHVPPRFAWLWEAAGSRRLRRWPASTMTTEFGAFKRARTGSGPLDSFSGASAAEAAASECRGATERQATMLLQRTTAPGASEA